MLDTDWLSGCDHVLSADGRPLRRATIASRDRFRPMGARHNLVSYYEAHYKALTPRVLLLWPCMHENL